MEEVRYADSERQFIFCLASDWDRLNLTTDNLSFRDYVRIIDYLFDTTSSQQRTIAIFTAVINQAKELGKSGEWVNKELIFEAGGELTDSRLDLLRMNLHHGPITDDVLDLYNERINRFKPGNS